MREIDNKILIDWVHLPYDTKVEPLWECLHDADLKSIKSDLLNRTLILNLHVPYINDFHKFSDEMLFQFLFECVTSVRAVHFSIWPGKFTLPSNISRDQESKLIDEYQSKWREESMDWNDFEKEINSSQNKLWIKDANLGFNDKQLSFKSYGHVEHKLYEFYIRAESLKIFYKKEQVISFDDFLQLGREYWDDFNKESKLTKK
jgi:hypothetical protein